jgi:hypothetical protein
MLIDTKERRTKTNGNGYENRSLAMHAQQRRGTLPHFFSYVSFPDASQLPRSVRTQGRIVAHKFGGSAEDS